MTLRITSCQTLRETNRNSSSLPLSEDSIATIVATGKQYFIRDPLLTGFAIRVSPKGKANYIVESRVKGQTNGSARRITLGSVQKVSLKEARKRAVLLLSEFESGVDPVKAKYERELKGTTLGALLEQFLATKRLKERTKRDYRADIEKYFKSYLNKPVISLEPSVIRSWYISGANTPVSIDRAYRALKSVLQFGVGMQVIESNPAQSVTDMGIRYKPSKRNSFIPFDEVGLLLKAIIELSLNDNLNVTVRDWFLLVLFTGLRSLESRSILKSDLDFKGRRFTVRETKNSKALILPMTDTLYNLFKFQCNHNSSCEYVFPNRFGTGKLAEHRKSVSKIYDKASVEHKTIHDLRRTFASMAEFIGINQNIISVVLNHSARNITQQYIQVQWPVIVEAMTRVEAFINQQYAKIALGKMKDLTDLLYR
ncbi:MAG TPA: integrase family protein [Kangiella sp.]